jgi:hypothetical protein
MLADGADENGEIQVPERVRVALCRRQIDALDQAIAAHDDKLIETVKADEKAGRLMTIPGVGPAIATAVVATVGATRTCSGIWISPFSFASRRSPPRRPHPSCYARLHMRRRDQFHLVTQRHELAAPMRRTTSLHRHHAGREVASDDDLAVRADTVHLKNSSLD